MADLIEPDYFPKEGTWIYSPYFVQVETVLSHGFRPSEFGLCDPEDDLSIIVAHSDTKARMQSYQEKRQRQKAK